jgi:hypothetical protein
MLANALIHLHLGRGRSSLGNGRDLADVQNGVCPLRNLKIRINWKISQLISVYSPGSLMTHHLCAHLAFTEWR